MINHLYDETLKAAWYFHFSKKLINSVAEKCGTKEFMIELGEKAGLRFRDMVPIKQFFGCEGNKFG